MKIWAHTLVKNEDAFVWYAVASVVNFVDRVLVWDSGSTDKTLEIIEALKRKYPSKIDVVKTSGEFNEEKIRQEMLEASDADWMIIVDGDEIWWDESIKKITQTIRRKGEAYDSIITPMVYPVGDIFHRQEEAAGKYRFGSKTGHFAQRAISLKIPGLHSTGEHGVWGWADGEGKMIQEKDSKRMLFVDAPYFHTTHLVRSSKVKEQVVKRGIKRKHEIGNPFPLDYYYPEVFFRERPRAVPSPWRVMDTGFRTRALIETPLRKIKRRIFTSKVGY